MCLNRKVLAGAAVAALAVIALAPDAFRTVAPLLILAVCPLSMVVMMRSMNRESGRCSTERPGTSSRSIEEGEAEIARLRAELSQLETERGATTA